MEQGLPPAVRRVIVLFPVAWTLHDLEEVVTMGTWNRLSRNGSAGDSPGSPARSRSGGNHPAQATLAMGVIGGIVTWSSLRALRSRSWTPACSFLPSPRSRATHLPTSRSRLLPVATCPVPSPPPGRAALLGVGAEDAAPRRPGRSTTSTASARLGMALMLPPFSVRSIRLPRVEHAARGDTGRPERSWLSSSPRRPAWCSRTSG